METGLRKDEDHRKELWLTKGQRMNWWLDCWTASRDYAAVGYKPEKGERLGGMALIL